MSNYHVDDQGWVHITGFVNGWTTAALPGLDQVDAGRDYVIDPPTLADNPYPIGTSAHKLWTRDWIDVESARRRAAGTYGASPEDHERAANEARAAGVVVDRDPTAILNEPWPELDTVAPERKPAPLTIEDVLRSFGFMGDALERMAASFSAAIGPMVDSFNALHNALVDAGFVPPALPSDPKERALAVKRARTRRTCPSHGVELHGGLCRRCSRRR